MVAMPECLAISLRFVRARETLGRELIRYMALKEGVRMGIPG
jgi:hypothetical protein